MPEVVIVPVMTHLLPREFAGIFLTTAGILCVCVWGGVGAGGLTDYLGKKIKITKREAERLICQYRMQ